jgi:hypothetical protein
MRHGLATVRNSSQLLVARMSIQVTAFEQERQGGNVSPTESAISTGWQLDERQIPDLGQGCPVVPLSADLLGMEA